MAVKRSFMPHQAGKQTSKQYRPNYLYSIISIALVLYMLGLLGLIVLHAQELSDYFKEKIEVSLILKDNSSEGDVLRLQKTVQAAPYTKQAKFVSKKEAAASLRQEIDEDFLDLLGYNPLYASINLHLNAPYANPDSLKQIEAKLAQKPIIKDVYYEKSLVSLIHKNVRTIGIIILSLSALLFLITLTLINNTIRLSMYSNRFLIKSMQLVGASWGFITRPFVKKAIINGFISGIIAVSLLGGTLYYAQQQLPELKLLQDIPRFVILFILVILIGIIISWVSTLITVRKYLKMRLDDLY